MFRNVAQTGTSMSSCCALSPRLGLEVSGESLSRHLLHEAWPSCARATRATSTGKVAGRSQVSTPSPTGEMTKRSKSA
ncbi:hypothetical protein ACFFX0_29065 [Citricoccus parietis]|uniref:Uncharacterized protein n=1 Tax=Citricoccus parietis TaxID=592307 RepID=A0ABV5G7T4_9MICC